MTVDSAALKAIFTIDNKDYKVPGGNIKVCSLDLLEQGFSGFLEFVISDETGKDQLYPPFGSDSLITICLTYKNYTFNSKVEAEEMTLKGIVAEREIHEIHYDEIKDSPILLRKYRCFFQDPARFLWAQHYPCELYVKKTLKDVIAAQVIPPITLDIKWEKLTEEQPMICLAMGACRVSFYDFLIDYIEGNCGYLLYDYENNSYQITGEKGECKKQQSFLPHQVTDTGISYGVTKFSGTNILNGHAENPGITQVTANQKVTGIKKDRLIITPFAKKVEQQKALETTKGEQPQHEFSFRFTSFPLKKMFPGNGICFSHEKWNKKHIFYNKPYRTTAVHIRLEANNPHPDHNVNLDHTEYAMDIRVRNEPPGNKVFSPDMPVNHLFSVEGLIVCDAGEKTDKTYQYSTNDQTKQHEYRVKIPLWDMEIKVLYKPDYINPHFYFPLYKDTPVLLEMTLFEGRIIRVLDWGKGVFLDQETQGNHLLFGKNEKDETSVKHEYENNKPVFSIKRKKEKDSGLFRMEEGVMILETKEE